MKRNIFLLAATVILFFTACNNQKTGIKESAAPQTEIGIITGSYIQKLDMVTRENPACSYASQTDTTRLREFAKKFLADVTTGKYKIYDGTTDITKIDSSTPFSMHYNFERFDTIMRIDPATLKQYLKVVKRNGLRPANLISLKIYNVVYTNPDGRIYSKIKAMAPYYPDYDDDGNYRGDAIAFWAVVE
jgi:hypothetical protein